MKKGLLLMFALLLFGKLANAQIALAYDDTTICRGDQITMSASFSGLVGNISQDDVFDNQVVNIGFPFQFYGNTYTQCVISANGFISFNTALAGGFSSWVWSTAINSGQVNSIISPGFQDLWPIPTYGGKIWYQSFGAVGSRRFIVEWCDLVKYGCTQFRVTMQLILYEGSNIIEFHVKSLPGTPGCPTSAPNVAIQGLRWLNGTTLNEIYTPNRGPGQNWGATGATNSSTRYTPTAAAPFYTVDTGIAFNPWLIIENINAPQLQWFDANGTYLGQGASINVTPINPPQPATQTFYVVSYTGLAGCVATTNVTFLDTVIVRYSDIKTYTTAEMCAGSTYDFYGRTLFSPGTYDTIFPSFIGCDSMIILNLTVNPLPNAEINGNTKVKICQGDRYLFRGVKGANNQYQWKKDGVNVVNANSDTLSAALPGVYTLEVTTDKGCKKTSRAVELIIAPNPTVKINYVSSVDICATDTVTLSAMATGNNIEYVWSPEPYFRRTAGSSTHAKVDAIIPKSGYVYVKVYNNDLCTAMDSVFIKAEPCCEMRMPTAFTPNGDGKNDYFLPKVEVGQKIFFFQVLDRYGKVVYETSNFQAQGWDGTYPNGKLAGQGVYIYVLKYACSDDKNYEKKGDIMLMR